MPGVVYTDAMAGVFELEMDGSGGPGHIPSVAGSAGLAAEANNRAEEVEVDEENMSKDAMAVDIREMKGPDMQKLNEVRNETPSQVQHDK